MLSDNDWNVLKIFNLLIVIGYITGLFVGLGVTHGSQNAVYMALICTAIFVVYKSIPKWQWRETV